MTLRSGAKRNRDSSYREGTINLSGPSEFVADRLQGLFTASGCDGFVVEGDWNPMRVNAVCNQVAATLRRRGCLSVPAPQVSLRRRVLGA